MADTDKCWIQRLNHYNQALDELREAVDLEQQHPLSKLEEQGLIQSFEYTYELAWNMLKDYFESQGEVNLFGSRDVIRLAFKRGLISEGEIWMDMIKSRARTSHTYNQNLAKEIANKIIDQYFGEFVILCTKMKAIGEEK